ncbi:MAG: hypothetical protein TREMPRED_001969 [Tremellales sp. Tagirdzhanova-0007]|nr:MAG: hypothetical protein TREMPRED_001969 [Tremellales sp. Tagirdzhanova-0007]
MSLFQRMTMTMPADGMGMDNSSTTTTMIMGPFTTDVGTSILWFANWIPTTAPATFAACVGLFFLGISSRYLEALRLACLPPLPASQTHYAPPRFRLGPECVCSGLYMLYSGINYFLMLAVMQFSVWFFIAIVIGLGAGEMAFGRFCRTQAVTVTRRRGGAQNGIESPHSAGEYSDTYSPDEKLPR